MMPGAFNAATARLVERAGFPAVYVSGAGLANATAGVPDIGLLTLTEVAQLAGYIADAVRIPALADADTGFGGPEHVARTVHTFERAGLAGMHLEDQAFKKRCGHLVGKELIPLEEATAKIVAAAQAGTSATFAFLGPDLLSRSARRRLFSLPNVQYLGVRPHRSVRAYLEAFDVCLIPHRVTEFTRGLDPLKVYEYLAAGRPIVSTPLPVAAELVEYVTYARSPDELVSLAHRELAADGPARRRARWSAVRERTWAARAERVEQVLIECRLVG